jgi:hypothetical protein
MVVGVGGGFLIDARIFLRVAFLTPASLCACRTGLEEVGWENSASSKLDLHSNPVKLWGKSPGCGHEGSFP